jgi:hypothetical protein
LQVKISVLGVRFAELFFTNFIFFCGGGGMEEEEEQIIKGDEGDC